VAASVALASSPVPWNGPIAAVRVGRVEGNWILNPTFQQLEFSTVDITVSGSADSVVMVEGGALEVSEAEVLEALKVAQKGIKELLGLQEKIIAKAKTEKLAWVKAEPDAALVKRVTELAEADMAKGMVVLREKLAGGADMSEISRQVRTRLTGA